MAEKERYATVGTWTKLFQEEGCKVSEYPIRNRVKEAGLLGRTYLNQLGRVIPEGFYRESEVRQACSDILVLPLNKSYFQSQKNLKADLTAFASELGPDKSPLDFNTGNFMSLSTRCQNGQIVKGQTYLTTAAKVLGLAKDNKEASSKMNHILRHLLKLADFQPLDWDYFQNPQNLKADLTAFASELGPDKTPLDLKATKISVVSIRCRNGQTMNGAIYLTVAAKVLGFARKSKEAKPRLPHTLWHLLKLAGFEPFDKDYFENSQNLRADLTALAKALGQDKSVLDLNTRNVITLSIRCQNGQVMRGVTYLATAAKALGFATNTIEASSKKAQILGRLKEMAGYLIEKQ